MTKILGVGKENIGKSKSDKYLIKINITRKIIKLKKFIKNIRYSKQRKQKYTYKTKKLKNRSYWYY